MQEPVNGSAVVVDQAGLTLDEVLALNVGDIVGELKASGEDACLLEATSAENRTFKIGVIVTLGETGTKYIEAVKARMRKEAERKHAAEQEAAKAVKP